MDRCPDRWLSVSEECTRVGLKPVRVPAVDGKLWDGNGWKKQGRINETYWRGSAGCYFSHIKALETAIASPGDFPCLILEDDVVFDAVPESGGGGNAMVGRIQNRR